MRFGAFFIGFTCLTIAGLFYLYRRFSHPPESRLLAPRWAGSMASVIFVGLFFTQLSYRAQWIDFGSPAQRAISLTGFTLMGLIFTLLVVLLAHDAITAIGRVLAARLWPKPNPVSPARRAALSRALKGGAIGLSSTLTAVGWAEARRPPTVERVTVPLSRLSADWRGARIVQLTDTHIGPTLGRDFVEALVRETNALSPDIVALTGDLVDGDPNDLRHALEPLADLKATHGVFAVTGNHEYYWGAETWVKFFAGLKIEFLLNEHRLLRRGSSAIALAGVTDLMAARFIPSHASSPAQAFAPVSTRAVAEIPEDVPRILLAHQPRSCFEAARAGCDLMLSGHTHGGQFFPWSLIVYFAQPYVKGLNRHGDMWVYVSRGTGYWGPPNRLGLPAEITLIELETA